MIQILPSFFNPSLCPAVEEKHKTAIRELSRAQGENNLAQNALIKTKRHQNKTPKQTKQDSKS